MLRVDVGFLKERVHGVESTPFFQVNLFKLGYCGFHLIDILDIMSESWRVAHLFKLLLHVSDLCIFLLHHAQLLFNSGFLGLVFGLLSFNMLFKLSNFKLEIQFLLFQLVFGVFIFLCKVSGYIPVELPNRQCELDLYDFPNEVNHVGAEAVLVRTFDHVKHNVLQGCVDIIDEFTHVLVFNKRLVFNFEAEAKQLTLKGKLFDVIFGEPLFFLSL